MPRINSKTKERASPSDRRSAPHTEMALRSDNSTKGETVYGILVGCAEDFILPCMIGIGHPADNAEYPTQTYPALADCAHWNK